MTVAADPFTDIHCHLLPCLDDGPADWADFLALSRLAVADGIGTVVVTPHQLGRFEHVAADDIRRVTRQAQRQLDTSGIPLVLLPGAEVRVREGLVELVRAGSLCTLAEHGAHLLLELPSSLCLPLGRLLYQLDADGVCAILSHPERHRSLMQNIETLRAWVQQGCLVQIGAASVVGDFGRATQQACRRLLDQRLVHFVASDAHHPDRRPPRMRAAFSLVARWFGESEAKRLFVANPRAVAVGQSLRLPLPLGA